MPCLTPPGRRTVRSILEHYAKLNDIQTVAMVACVVSIPDRIVAYQDRLSKVLICSRLPPSLILLSKSDFVCHVIAFVTDAMSEKT